MFSEIYDYIPHLFPEVSFIYGIYTVKSTLPTCPSQHPVVKFLNAHFTLLLLYCLAFIATGHFLCIAITIISIEM